MKPLLKAILIMACMACMAVPAYSFDFSDLSPENDSSGPWDFSRLFKRTDLGTSWDVSQFDPRLENWEMVINRRMRDPKNPLRVRLHNTPCESRNLAKEGNAPVNVAN